jgi:hypothetical protein
MRRIKIRLWIGKADVKMGGYGFIGMNEKKPF